MSDSLTFSRRHFLMGAAASTAAASHGFSWPFFGSSEKRFDDRLTLFISDLHISGRADKPQHYQLPRFQKVVDKILQMDVLPRRCLCLGDIAWSQGDPRDYAASRPALERLTAAGIELTLTMGNHDHRQTCAAVWPELAARSVVPGHFVTPVSTPDCDFILFDSLSETGPDEKSYNNVYGELTKPVQDWMARELPKWPRPFFLCAHHSFDEVYQHKFTELTVHGRPLKSFLADTPNLVGYIHGHDHHWTHGCEIADWKRRRLFQRLVLPSTGHWGDIGYVLFRTEPGKAVAELYQDDFFFPVELPPEKCAADWSAMVAANRGAVCNFAWRP